MDLVQVLREVLRRQDQLTARAEQALEDSGATVGTSWQGTVSFGTVDGGFRASARAGLVSIEVAPPPFQISASALPRMFEMCACLNRNYATAGFHVMLTKNGEPFVMNKRDFMAFECAEVLDTPFVANLVDVAVADMREFWPALRFVADGANVREALDVLPGRPYQSTDWDVRLLEETVAIWKAKGHPEPRRLKPTLLQGGSVFIDFMGGNVLATSYVFRDDQVPPPSRRPALAELINRIAASGVPFSFGLELDSCVVRLKTYAPLDGTTIAERAIVAFDAIQMAAGGTHHYSPVFRRVGSTAIAPASALAAHEQS